MIPSVYGASKINEWETWVELKKSRQDIRFTAGWPDLSAKGVSNHPDNCKIFWLHDFADIHQADYVLVLPPRDGVLRGALVEVGYGIACGKHIVLTGDCPDYGTWQFHPMVTKVASIDEALTFIKGDWK